MVRKNIVITGASSGIGAATARRFAQEGFQVILIARRKEKLEELQKEIGKENVAFFDLDITDSDGVKQTFKKIEKEFRSIEILVNNAGGAFGLDKAHEADLQDWEKCVDVNIKGLLYCTHAVLPGMVKRNRGTIINLGSVAGQYPYLGGNVYGAAKAFVRQFSLNLRSDLLGTKVKVTCIEPGLVGETEFSHVRFHGDEERAKKVYQGMDPLKPSDVADMIWFCTVSPPRMNLNTVEIMPIDQAFGSFSVYRRE